MIGPTQFTLADLIHEAQIQHGHDDPTMVEWLGLETVAVFKAIKTGKMRFPNNRARQLAELLDMEPREALRLILLETDSNLLDAIELCMGPLDLTDAEIRIINAIRKVGTGPNLVPITFDRDAIVTLVVQGP